MSMYIKATNKLINRIFESLSEKEIYKNIGAEDFFSNKTEVEIFFRNLFSMQEPKKIKGYKYCYYYYKLESYIEFVITVRGDKAPNSANFVGIDMHFCSNSRVIADIHAILEREKSVAKIMVSDQVGRDVYADLICADILPKLTKGTEIKTQAMVYPDSVFVYDSMLDWEKASAKNVSFELGLLTTNDKEKSFTVSSEVLDVFDFEFKANTKVYKFYEIVVGNALGVLSALVTAEMLNKVPQKGNILDMTVRHLSLDCAVKDYEKGRVVNSNTCLDTVIDALVHKSADRIFAVTSSDCTYGIADAEKLHKATQVDIESAILNYSEEGVNYSIRAIETATEIIPSSYIGRDVVKVELPNNEFNFIIIEHNGKNAISKIIIDKAGNITPKSPFTEDEYFIFDALKYVGAEKDEFIGILALLNDNEKNSADCKAKLVKYLKLKGKYITLQDILKMSHRLTRDREQYYPCEMYVKYIGETTEQLTNNKVYHVEMVFDCDEIYLIRCDNLSVREFSAELFEVQRVTKVEYVGSTDEDDEERITIGFEKGKIYSVDSMRVGQYTCEGGIKCMLDEVVPVEFVLAEKKEPSPLKDIDEAILFLRDALEFNSLHLLIPHLHPNCKYISQPGKREFNTKKEFIECWRRVGKAQVEQDFFVDCAIGTVTKSDETNMFPVGTRCVAMYEEKGCADVAFVTLSEDKRYITGVYVLNEYYEFQLDPADCDAEK